MLYMKGVPDLPRCGFSSLAVRVLKEYSYYGILTIDMPFADVPLSARNILEDPELKNAVKAYRGLLKFMTDRGRIYLSTSCRNFRGTDMLNNDHMMIMFLAVTSTFAMAMVPFAKTATTVSMMYPTMTVMSSTVTTTMATMSTMSVITITMLMNMMSPAMTMVLVNKDVPSCDRDSLRRDQLHLRGCGVVSCEHRDRMDDDVRRTQTSLLLTCLSKSLKIAS